MSKYLLIRLNNFMQRIENAFPILFGRGFPPQDGFCVAVLPSRSIEFPSDRQNDRFSLKSLLGDGIFWAVPKHRRTVEKRLNRKYGNPMYHWKLLKPKTNLKVCTECGHDHEVGVLCPNCYDRVRQETNQMRDRIQEELGLEPVEKEVVVLYDGEKNNQPAEIIEGKRVVEMKKPRPMWFSKNLLQKSTQQPATTKDVKPDELG